MATEVELFEQYDLPGRESIRGLIDSNGKAQIQLGGRPVASYSVDGSGNVTGLVGPSGTNEVFFAKSKYDRAPTPKDNSSLGYDINSVWQYNGDLYQPIVAPTSTSAVWGVNQRSTATVVDIVGVTNTKFAGGTVAMKGGFTGPAIDISVTISATPTTFTINVLSTGELDNVSCNAAIGQRDSGTFVTVIKIYDQSGNGNHVLKDASFAAPFIDWDSECGRFVITSSYDYLGVARQLRIPNTLTTNRSALSMFALGRSVNAADGNGSRILATAGDYLGGAGQIAAWQPLQSGSMSVANNPAGGTQTPTTPVPFISTICISGFTAGTAQNNYFCNDITGSKTIANASVVLTGGWIFTDTGSSAARRSPVRLFGFAICDQEVSAAKVTAIKNGFYAQFNALPQAQDRVFLIGDSRFAGAFANLDRSFAVHLTQYLPTKPKVINLSSGGHTNALAATYSIPTAVSLYKSGVKNVAIVLLGVNDFMVSSLTVAQSLAALTSNVATLKAAGMTVIVISELATTVTTGSASTLVPQLRTLINANSMGADAIVDVSVYAEILAASNTAYYPDGLHMSAGIHSLIAGATGDAVTKLLI
jgi:hypothetical protein